MKKTLKTTGYILLLMLVYMLLQGFFTFISMFVAVLYAIAQGEVSPEVFEQNVDYDILLSSLTANNIYIWAMTIGLFTATVAMLFFIYIIKGYRIKTNIFRSISSKSLVLSTMLVFSSMMALNILVQWFQLEDKLAVEFDGLTHNAVGVVAIALLAPLLEEVLFRGAIQGYMLRRYKPWVAILCAALVFGVFHMNPVQTVYATLLGCVLGWIYYRTGSLLSVIVGHVLNNSIATITMLLFGTGGVQSLSAGIVSPMAEIVSEVFAFLFFAILSVYFAVRLHRVQPAVPSPWQDTGGDVK